MFYSPFPLFLFHLEMQKKIIQIGFTTKQESKMLHLFFKKGNILNKK